MISHTLVLIVQETAFHLNICFIGEFCKNFQKQVDFEFEEDIDYITYILISICKFKWHYMVMKINKLISNRFSENRNLLYNICFNYESNCYLKSWMNRHTFVFGQVKAPLYSLSRKTLRWLDDFRSNLSPIDEFGIFHADGSVDMVHKMKCSVSRFEPK